jgi:hypothetical protein
MKAKLSDGFEVELNEKYFGSWKFLTVLRKIDKGEEALIVDVSEDLLGEEGLDTLMKHLDPNGDPSVTDMVDALTELMTSVNELKN